MIVGHGIDLQEIEPIRKAYEKNPRFARRILTEKEFMVFSSLKGKRQIEFLAGRWSAKEAFSKACGTGIGKLSFQDLEVLNNDKGAPCFTKSPFSGRTFISISHSGNLVQASVILEEVHDC
ncbi:holo-ACP synthase [Streptococcus caprae]|uniref:Holo-[acyl-carrier-protein] synthase n=1 Tax=Streptococcus caprae TaxID=1640501 RepID=A0ABV8CWQ1_9STRE